MNKVITNIFLLSFAIFCVGQQPSYAFLDYLPGVTKVGSEFDFSGAPRVVYPLLCTAIVGTGTWLLASKVAGSSARHKAFLELKRRVIKEKSSAGEEIPEIYENNLTPEISAELERELKKDKWQSYKFNRALLATSLVAGLTGLLTWRFAHVRTKSYNEKKAADVYKKMLALTRAKCEVAGKPVNLHAAVMKALTKKAGGISVIVSRSDDDANFLYEQPGSEDGEMRIDESASLQSVVSGTEFANLVELSDEYENLQEKLACPFRRGTIINLPGGEKLKYKNKSGDVKNVTTSGELMKVIGTLSRRLRATDAYAADCLKLKKKCREVATGVDAGLVGANLFARLFL